MIRVAQHELPEAAVGEALAAVCGRDARLTQGVLVERLERALGEYSGAPSVVAFASCTAALQCVLEFLRQGRPPSGHGPTVARIPSMTYVSVAEAVLRSGLELVFQDRIEVGRGYALDLDGPGAPAGAPVVDSAHEFDRGTWRKWGAGFVALSFYPTKCLAGAEGGAVLTDVPPFVEYAKAWRIGGRTRMGGGYEITRRGWKANMTDVQAAILLPQLPAHLDRLNTRRVEIRDAYNAALGERNTSLHLYTIDVAERDAFVEYMREHEVETSVHFPPLHLQAPYRTMKTAPGMSATLTRWATTVSLPFHTKLTSEDIVRVVQLVERWRRRRPAMPGS